MTQFTFTPDTDGALTIENAVGQALGAASMCWDPTPAGIFDSTRAEQITTALIAEFQRQRPVP